MIRLGELMMILELHRQGLSITAIAADFLVAHNAPFDRGVLHACCAAAGIVAPKQRFRCTVQLARTTWRLPSAKLPAVCQHLGIPLDHHNAISDAEACAKIAIAAL